jgi:peptidoglycan hydrolase-like protein with peptidoglycan-binding domain
MTEHDRIDRQPRRLGRWLAAAVALLVVAGAAFWAGRVTLQGPSDGQQTQLAPVLAEVTEQTVGKVLRYNVTVTRSRTPVVANMMVGMVTKVAKAGKFGVGEVVYAVDAIPVRVVAGTTPFYRSLSIGAKGSDVAQLRAALHKLGYLSISSGSSYDQSTSRAVKAWQRALGIPQTGTVDKGELIAVAKLPASLSLDTKILRRGALLQGGEQALFSNTGTPTFALELSQSEAEQVSIDAAITVNSDDASWPAKITKSEQLSDGTTRFSLAAPKGGVVCGDECGKLPAGSSKLYLLSKISVVEPQTGPAVPVAAITTQADGSTTVMVAGTNGDLEQRSVTVKGSQDGVAVVEGVQVGESVQVLSGTTQTAPAATSSTSGPTATSTP